MVTKQQQPLTVKYHNTANVFSIGWMLPVSWACVLFWWKRSAVSWPALVMLPMHCSGRIEEKKEASHSRQNMFYYPESAEK